MEAQQLREEFGAKAPAAAPADPEVASVIRAWNLLGGLDWAGLEPVMDLIGFDDPELLIHGLTTLRDHFQRAP